MENNLKRITAVLGPTNTGKTHLAVDTMLEYKSDNRPSTMMHRIAKGYTLE